MMSKTIESIQEEIISEFNDFEDWEEKYEFIVELGFELEPLAEEHKIEAKRIMGCQSNVWLNADYDADTHKMLYQADSESMIVKGLISLLIQVLSQQSPDDILKSELFFLHKIGLDQHLSSTRTNGLSAMIQEMRKQAALHLVALKSDSSSEPPTV